MVIASPDIRLSITAGQQTYTPVESLSPKMAKIADRFTKRRDLPTTLTQLHEQPQTIEVQPLDDIAPYYQVLLLQDFADSDRALDHSGRPLDYTFATQHNAKTGQIQRAEFDRDGQLVVTDDAVIDYRASQTLLVNRRHPQAWAPSPYLPSDGDHVELYISMGILGKRRSKDGMGIVRAIAKDFNQPFALINVLASGRGFRIIDQHPYHGRLFNDQYIWKDKDGWRDYLWLLYGSMWGSILAQPLDSSHTRFSQPKPLNVLSPNERVPQSKLIEAPIPINACGEDFLFVSGCGCFGEDANNLNDEYCVMQAKYDSQTGRYQYRSLWAGQEADNSVVLASNQWFYNPGHPSIYRSPEDGEDQLTMDFSAIPWYRDAEEQADNIHFTADNRVRYLFRCKLKLRNGWWELDRQYQIAGN